MIPTGIVCGVLFLCYSFYYMIKMNSTCAGEVIIPFSGFKCKASQERTRHFSIPNPYLMAAKEGNTLINIKQ